MNHDSYSDDFIRAILRETRVIAMVGASPNWNRPSYFAMKYLQAKGYRVIPVNPREAGKEILGEKVYADLASIPVKVDMVDCFRNSDSIPPIAEDAIKIGAKVLWMQLGVRNDEAAARAEDAGLKVVMNRCPKIEYGRLSREIGWMGVNTGVISAKKQQRV
ncbi:CoA-binding protein [Ferrovibrio sp.]|uniref:CoA-binding protein n=1 Tax=Ferrovibrio sp. TaxID=1917215 RepID=UPI0035AF63DB